MAKEHNEEGYKKLMDRIHDLQVIVEAEERAKNSQNKLENFRDKVKSTVTKLVETKKAPWLQSHDGNKELSYFPSTGFTPAGFTAVWLKIREQQLGSSDPRWYSQIDIYRNKYHIKHNEKATLLSFQKDDNSVSFKYYWNAQQLTGVPPYEKSFNISNEKQPIYYPEATGFGKNRHYHPQETLRADLANYLISLETHSPYEPKGIKRAEIVKDYLDKSKSGVFFYVSKDASITAKKVLEKSINEKTISKEKEVVQSRGLDITN